MRKMSMCTKALTMSTINSHLQIARGTHIGLSPRGYYYDSLCAQSQYLQQQLLLLCAQTYIWDVTFPIIKVMKIIWKPNK